MVPRKFEIVRKAKNGDSKSFKDNTAVCKQEWYKLISSVDDNYKVTIITNK